jgi:hypothetical protein
MKIMSNYNRNLLLAKIKLCICFLILSIFFVYCNSTSDNKQKTLHDSSTSIHLTKNPNDTLDSIIIFLLEASAKDFHEHQVPIPVKFRNVQVRNQIGANAEDHYLICGQFLDESNQNANEWTSFATIKTSGYEQWIGNQSLPYCQDSKAIAYKIQDLSFALKSKIDSLHNLK